MTGLPSGVKVAEKGWFLSPLGEFAASLRVWAPGASCSRSALVARFALSVVISAPPLAVGSEQPKGEEGEGFVASGKP